MKMINFTKFKNLYLLISAILIFFSIFSLIKFGLNLGIDFTGGSSLEIEFLNERPPLNEIKKSLSKIDLGEFYLRGVGKNGIILEIEKKNINPDLKDKILKEIEKFGKIKNPKETFHFKSISPTIGKELTQKAKIFVFLSVLSILIYIAFAFFKLKKPISFWQCALISILALFHDILIPLGLLSFLKIPINIPIVVALLTILGYSINNTVVVFDRVRENLLKERKSKFEDTINLSLCQVLTRSLNTSLTTLFVLISIFFFGGETLKYFALTLILGIIAGTYSSLFLVTSLSIEWAKWRQNF